MKIAEQAAAIHSAAHNIFLLHDFRSLADVIQNIFEQSQSSGLPALLNNHVTQGEICTLLYSAMESTNVANFNEHLNQLSKLKKTCSNLHPIVGETAEFAEKFLHRLPPMP